MLTNRMSVHVLLIVYLFAVVVVQTHKHSVHPLNFCFSLTVWLGEPSQNVVENESSAGGPSVCDFEL